MLTTPSSHKHNRDLKSSNQLLEEFMSNSNIDQQQQRYRLQQQQQQQQLQRQQQQQYYQQDYFAPIAQSTNFLDQAQQTPNNVPRKQQFQQQQQQMNIYSEKQSSNAVKDDNWDDLLASQNEETRKRSRQTPKQENRLSIATSRAVLLDEGAMRLAEKKNSLRARLEFEYFAQNSAQKINNPVYLEQDGEKYEGEIKEMDGKSVYHGRGKLEMRNGDSYIGEFFRGLMNGYGVLTSREDGSFYAGNFVSGEKNGKGEQHFANGDVYYGEFKHNIMHDNMAKFVVEKQALTFNIPYSEGVMHGEGTMYEHLTNNTKPVKFIRGELYVEKKQEKAKEIVIPVEEEKEEEVKRAIRKPFAFVQTNSDPILVDPKTEANQLLEKFRQEMQYEADMMGVKIIKETLPQRQVYEGPNSDKLSKGKAIYIFEDGTLYAGEWTNGLQEGPGFYFDPSIGLYKGNFTQGMKHGFGSMNYINGDLYEGDWDFDKKHGQNAIYYAFRKNIKLTGRAENGKFISMKQESLSATNRNHHS